VVVQNNVFNASRINTTVVCAPNSNLKQAQAPGNVLLDQDEGNLLNQNVALMSQLFTIKKAHLGEYIGAFTCVY
jgi:mRNA interferase MazF